MPRVEVSRVLLASRADAWRFVSDPHNLADWWPGLGGVQPDRRGLAPGARWQISGAGRPSFFRRAGVAGMLLVLRVEPPDLLAWQFVNERLDVELRFTSAGPDRTRATLALDGPLLFGFGRAVPRRALQRLYALCQTAADE